jgi:hypothetical protein
MAASSITRIWTEKPPDEKGMVDFVAREGLPLWKAMRQAVNDIISGGAGALFTVTSTKTANYSAAINEMVLADATAGPFTVTLPASSATTKGRLVAVKLLSVANAVTVTDGGAFTQVLPLTLGIYFFGSDGL